MAATKAKIWTILNPQISRKPESARHLPPTSTIAPNRASLFPTFQAFSEQIHQKKSKNTPTTDYKHFAMPLQHGYKSNLNKQHDEVVDAG
jgi:hypothetical protein